MAENQSAANLLGRKFVGIDTEEKYLSLSRCRKREIEIENKRRAMLEKCGLIN